MIVYAWKFTTYDDPAEQFMADYLQFSVQRNDIDQFCRLVIENENELHFITTSTPNGSPHFLDLEKDIILDPREEFNEITIQKNFGNKYPVEITINEGAMNISLTNEGCNLFVESLQKSKASGYYCEHNLNVRLKYKGQDSRDSKLIVWAAYEKGIVFY